MYFSLKCFNKWGMKNTKMSIHRRMRKFSLQKCYIKDPRGDSFGPHENLKVWYCIQFVCCVKWCIMKKMGIPLLSIVCFHMLVCCFMFMLKITKVLFIQKMADRPYAFIYFSWGIPLLQPKPNFAFIFKGENSLLKINIFQPFKYHGSFCILNSEKYWFSLGGFPIFLKRG